MGFKSARGSALAVLMLAWVPGAQAAEQPKGVALIQHRYTPGEHLDYVFEDTEYTFDATASTAGIRPGPIARVQELEIKARIGTPEKGPKREMRFLSASYRDGSPKSMPALQPVSSYIPSFPREFAYPYDSDQKAVTEVQRHYKPYLGSEVGNFLYYKALDVHTIQSAIDNIPSTMKPGDYLLRPAAAIPLKDGVFNNAAHSISYQRIDLIDGVRCAFFKVMNAGNSYQAKGNAPILTDYQYTFYVPLEGQYQGLLLRGELQETITVQDEKNPVFMVRQLSMQLERPEHRVL